MYKELKEDSNYLAYSNGRVFSKKTNSFLTGMVDGSGCHCYLLRLNGKSKFVRTNRLIAEYFVDNPDPEHNKIVNHIDGNKLNNDYSNLEWCPYSDNIKKYYQSNRDVKNSSAIYANDTDNIIWIPIEGFSRYEISSTGIIRKKSTKRIIRYDKGPKYSRAILIDDDGNRKHVLGHILVYCNFNNDFDLDGCVIDHIDANPRNNNINNLQKITPKQNSRRQERFKKFND